jgi:hypothetical protein
MSFNWQIFAANFLDQMTQGIKTRGAEAEQYKKEQKAAAERNYSLIQQRNNKAQAVASYGRQALALLENHPNADAIVRTAISSGPTGMVDLYEKLNTAANQPGMEGGLGLDDINAIINMPSIPEVDPSYIDMSLEDFAKQTYGASLGTPMDAEETDERSMMAQLFGFGAMKEADRELSQQAFARGMSVAEINTLARQEEFQSLMPGSTMTLRDLEVFAGDALSEFAADISTRMNAAARTVGEENTYNRDQIKEARAAAASLVVSEYASRYGQSFWNNDFTKRTLNSMLHDGAYDVAYNDFFNIEETEPDDSPEREPEQLGVGDRVTVEGQDGTFIVFSKGDGDLGVLTEQGDVVADDEAEAILQGGQKVEDPAEEIRTAATPLTADEKTEARQFINTILTAADYDLPGLISLSIPGNEILAQGKRNMARSAFSQLLAIDPGMQVLAEMKAFVSQPENEELAISQYGEELTQALRTLDIDDFVKDATNLNRAAQMERIPERGEEGYSDEEAQQNLESGANDMLAFLMLQNDINPNVTKDASVLADLSDEELAETISKYMLDGYITNIPPIDQVISYIRQHQLPEMYTVTPSRAFPTEYNIFRRR